MKNIEAKENPRFARTDQLPNVNNKPVDPNRVVQAEEIVKRAALMHFLRSGHRGNRQAARILGVEALLDR